jgi:hypothetical protein
MGVSTHYFSSRAKGMDASREEDGELAKPCFKISFYV